MITRSGKLLVAIALSQAVLVAAVCDGGAACAAADQTSLLQIDKVVAHGPERTREEPPNVEPESLDTDQDLMSGQTTLSHEWCMYKKHTHKNGEERTTEEQCGKDEYRGCQWYLVDMSDKKHADKKNVCGPFAKGEGPQQAIAETKDRFVMDRPADKVAVFYECCRSCSDERPPPSCPNAHVLQDEAERIDPNDGGSLDTKAGQMDSAETTEDETTDDIKAGQMDSAETTEDETTEADEETFDDDTDDDVDTDADDESTDVDDESTDESTVDDES